MLVDGALRHFEPCHDGAAHAMFAVVKKGSVLIR